MNSLVRVSGSNKQETAARKGAGVKTMEAEADVKDDDDKRMESRKRKSVQMLSSNPKKKRTAPSTQRRPTTLSTFVTPSRTQTFSDTIEEDDTPYGTFSSGTARKCYKFFVNKLALENKGFDDYCLNALPYVKRVFRNLGLESLCAVPDAYNLCMTKEFYAEVCAFTSNTVHVRGTYFSFEPEVIIEHLFKSLSVQVNTLTKTVKKQYWKLNRLEHFHKRNWEYEEAKDHLIKQAWDPIYANLVAVWPKFPEDVFDEYDDDTSEKEEGSAPEDDEASTDADHE